jgi:hypothetical protein
MADRPIVFSDNEFHKASRSGNQNWPNCVEIARRDGCVELRDSKRKGTVMYAATALQVTAREFDDFQDAVRAADLRTAHVSREVLTGCALAITRLGENQNIMHLSSERHSQPVANLLTYTDDELIAFFDGVHGREFDLDSVAV